MNQTQFGLGLKGNGPMPESGVSNGQMEGLPFVWGFWMSANFSAGSEQWFFSHFSIVVFLLRGCSRKELDLHKEFGGKIRFNHTKNPVSTGPKLKLSIFVDSATLA